jgi:NADH dehydrogenase FAD-containing subunit
MDKTQQHQQQLNVTRIEDLECIHFDFASVLDQAQLKSKFISHLTQNKTEESLFFVDAVQEYIQLHSDQQRYKKATEIVDKFIRVGAEHELNIDSMRSAILQDFSQCSIRECPNNIFSKVYTVMLVSLKEDSWRRFITSKGFNESVLELILKDQSIILDLCPPTEDNIDGLIELLLTDEERREMFFIDFRKNTSGIQQVTQKQRNTLFKRKVLCFSGYSMVNWVSGYFRIRRGSAIQLIKKLLLDNKIIGTLQDSKTEQTIQDTNDFFYKHITKKRLVIVGGGYGGSYVAKHLKNDYRVTLIDTKKKFESVFSFPQLLHDPSHYSKISCDHMAYVETGRVIIEKVKTVHPYYVQLQNERVYFDHLVMSTGSSYICFPIELTDENKKIITLNPYNSESLIKNHQEFKKAQRVVIIGAGPVGVEMCGEIAYYYPHTKIDLVTSSDRLMERTVTTVHDHAAKLLAKFNNVTIKYGARVQRIKDNTVIYRNVNGSDTEESLPFDIVVVAVGFRPNTQMFETHLSDSLDSMKRVEVNQYFQVQKSSGTLYENIYAIGDITNTTEERLAQVAQKNASKLCKILKTFDGQDLEKKAKSLTYTPKKRLMIVSVGPKHGMVIRDEKVILENALTLKAKAVMEYQLLRNIKQ